MRIYNTKTSEDNSSDISIPVSNAEISIDRSYYEQNLPYVGQIITSPVPPKAPLKPLAIPQDILDGNLVKKGPIKVLVIEDEFVMREAIRYTLKPMGLDLDLASSGEEGLEKLGNIEQHYDIVLIDLILHTGALNGINVFKEIQQKYKNLRVVFMTASGSRESIFEEAARLGPQILRKPFSSDDIKKIVSNINKVGD